MRLNNNNLFASKVFVADVCNDIEFFAYECDLDIPRVVVSKSPEINIDTFGDHCNITPFRWGSEEQFNNLCVQALSKSCEISNSITSDIGEAISLFNKRDLDINCIFVSKNSKISESAAPQILKILGESDKWHYWYHVIDGLADNEIMFLAPPEFLGVVSIKTDINSDTIYDAEYEKKYGVGAKDELYGVGIINTNAVVLVRSKT